MNSNISGIARLAAHANNPNGNPEPLALTAHDLDQVLACFSEIDTESPAQESSKIAYLEQMLRLQEPRHLTESQLSGRRFLLDMLSLMSLLPTGQQAQEVTLKDWHPAHPFKYLIYLLERTSCVELAARVTAIQGIQEFVDADFMALGQWLDRHGIASHELALIQPNFFIGARRAAPVPAENQGLHPNFVALAQASRERNHDYVAEAFLSLSEPLKLVQRSMALPAPMAHAGRGEAIASIYDTPYDPMAALQTRLKAFFIPNRFGEPMIALSFVNSY
jgi:hypothetical protein